MKVLKYQQWHLLALLIVLSAVFLYSRADIGILEGELWGIKTKTWLFAAILSTIIHQVYILICWRLQLFHQSLTNTFGQWGFKLYKSGVSVLILSRLITICILAIANSNTLDLNRVISYILAGVIFIPAACLFYLVKVFFGIDRAFGVDHFYGK